jgi:hypothetical protein
MFYGSTIGEMGVASLQVSAAIDSSGAFGACTSIEYLSLQKERKELRLKSIACPYRISCCSEACAGGLIQVAQIDIERRSSSFVAVHGIAVPSGAGQTVP